MKSASTYCTATSVRHNQRPGRRATCSAIVSPYRHGLRRQRRTRPPRMTAAYDRFSARAHPPPAQTKKTSLQGLPRKHAFPQSNLFGECTARRRAVRFASFGKRDRKAMIWDAIRAPTATNAGSSPSKQRRAARIAERSERREPPSARNAEAKRPSLGSCRAKSPNGNAGAKRRAAGSPTLAPAVGRLCNHGQHRVHLRMVGVLDAACRRIRLGSDYDIIHFHRAHVGLLRRRNRRLEGGEKSVAALRAHRVSNRDIHGVRPDGNAHPA